MPSLEILLSQPEWRIAVALALGLIIGAERERRKITRAKEDGVQGGASGVRTFALTALVGATSVLVGSPWYIAASALFMAGIAVSAANRKHGKDTGTTTEIALFLTFLLGSYAMHDPGRALSISILATLVLALRSRLHAAVSRVLHENVLIDGLTLGVAALVVLPLLPDKTIDPWNVVNPFVIWRLVVVVMAVHGFGHIAERLVGPRLGVFIAGFASGFVSGAATVAAMGSRTKDREQAVPGAVSGASAASVATYTQLSLLVGAANPHLLSRLAWSFGLGAAVILVFALAFTFGPKNDHDEKQDDGPHAIFDFKLGLFFAALISTISIAATLIRRSFGEAALRLVSFLAGFADTHAIAASAAATSASQAIPEDTALWAIMLALTSNTITKALLARSTGSSTYARRTILGLALMMIASWAGFWLS